MSVFQFVRQHKALSLAFLLATVVTIFFLIRTTVSFVYWSNPDYVDQPIAGWMTPLYVSKSWDLPPDVVANALSLERSFGVGRTTLDQIADQQGRDLEALIRDFSIAVETFRTNADE